MSLSEGSHLGPYEILAPLGAGGMGEVYRARDTKLKRDVALKVLPETFARDPDRMARFQREAEVLASLNHPNIAQIYGVEDRALVMELVEGQTLQGPLPVETALHYAQQIADALEAAHEKGIVHRDLKPANIMITAAGLVKVLDFGLAAVMQGPTGDPANSPTLTMRATEAGVIMGTAGYMAPEQASGKPVDKRADIWAFGVVLFEMLTGKRLFEGETLSHTLADVLRAPIGFEQLPGETPTAVRELLRRCLDREVRNRLRDIGEARVVLANPGKPLEAQTTRHRSNLPWIAVGALAVLLLALGTLYWRAMRPVERPLVRLEVDLGADVSLAPIGNNATSTAALSPDGTRLVYVAGPVGGAPRLLIRRLDQTKATELPGTLGAQGPFFSPDGQWVGFFAGGKLNKISVEGGAVVPLADIPIFGGASWGTDGNIVVSMPLTQGLTQISSGGGAPKPLTEMTNGEIAHAFPQILPGNQAVLFTVGLGSDPDRNSLNVVTLADHRRKTVARGASFGRYLASGHLVYVNRGTLFAVPFDLGRLETRGTPVPVLDDVAYNEATTGAQFTFAAEQGTVVYRRGLAGGSGRLSFQWVDASGKRDGLHLKPGVYGTPRLSPDGKRVAFFSAEGANQDIWVYDIARDATTRLTFGSGRFTAPVWSPDGRVVVFSSIGAGLWWNRADGAGQPQPLTSNKVIQIPGSFAPDASRVVYFEVSGAPQLWTLPIEGPNGQLRAGKPEPFLKSRFADGFPAFSPDGRWLAYSSNQSGGTTEVYVRAFPPPASGQGGQWQISNSGGQNAAWSRAGHELLYQSGDQIMAAGFSVNGDSFVAEKPRVWLSKLGGTAFDLAPDGKRLLVLTPGDTPETPKDDHQIVFLENFYDYLRQRVPLK